MSLRCGGVRCAALLVVLCGSILLSVQDVRASVDPVLDSDGDGVPDYEDAFPHDPTETGDLDLDGIGDNVDPDIDGDRVPNDQDAFPRNRREQVDTDGDGFGDNSDPDIDGDGIPNEEDAFPMHPGEWRDTDGSGLGDNADPDDDNDGVPDELDAFPHDPLESVDTDGDGIGDNSDPDIDGDGHVNDMDHYPYDPDEWEPHCAPGCVTDAVCYTDAHCLSRRCHLAARQCFAPACDDGIQNGNENLGVDLGGECPPSCSPECADGSLCFAGSQCQSGVCSRAAPDAGVCLAPTCDDGVRNGGEPAVDTGGPCPLRECTDPEAASADVRYLRERNVVIRRADSCLPEHTFCTGEPDFVGSFDGADWYIVPAEADDFACWREANSPVASEL